MMNVEDRGRLGGLLPEAERVRKALSQVEEEATLLRRLLALCLRGEQSPDLWGRLGKALSRHEV